VKIFSALLAFTFLASACAPVATPTPFPTATALPTQTRVATATSAPTSTATSAPTPTFTPIPSAAPSRAATVVVRATNDRPDDSPDYQVHVMYVLPGDSADQNLDTNGTIANSIAAIDRWFVGQSGGAGLRFDRSQGNLDITFVRLSATDAALAGTGGSVAYVRDRVEAELIKLGFNHPKKIYAVYYGGKSSYACGGGAWPPNLRGIIAALYLNGAPPGAMPCSRNPFASAQGAPGYWEFSILHEVLHTLGIVAECAPHHTRAGHVSDDPRDLMYAGDQPWQPSILDVGHDDYFKANRAGCLDLAQSAFLDPTPPNAVIPK